MSEQGTLLPESGLQAAVEASFTLRNWRYDVTGSHGRWTTLAVVTGPYGPVRLEVEVGPGERLTLRTEVGPRCTPATRAETALFLAWLNLWSGSATFALGPSTGRVYVRFGVGEVFAGRVDAHRVDLMIGELAQHHITFAPMVGRVARGDLGAAEAMRMIQLKFGVD
jgi:hypothetical protein